MIFFLFHIEIEGKCEWIIGGGGGGGGAKGYVEPPLKLLGGGSPLFLRLCDANMEDDSKPSLKYSMFMYCETISAVSNFASAF